MGSAEVDATVSGCQGSCQITFEAPIPTVVKVTGLYPTATVSGAAIPTVFEVKVVQGTDECAVRFDKVTLDLVSRGASQSLQTWKWDTGAPPSPIWNSQGSAGKDSFYSFRYDNWSAHATASGDYTFKLTVQYALMDPGMPWTGVSQPPAAATDFTLDNTPTVVTGPLAVPDNTTAPNPPPITGAVWLTATATPKIGSLPEIKVNGHVVLSAKDANPDYVDTISFTANGQEVAEPNSKQCSTLDDPGTPGTLPGPPGMAGQGLGLPLTCKVLWKSDKQNDVWDPLWPDGDYTLNAHVIAGASSADANATFPVVNQGEIKGKITDAETGDPAQWVTVQATRTRLVYIGPPPPTPPGPNATMDQRMAYNQAYMQWQQQYNDPRNWQPLTKVFDTATSNDKGEYSLKVYPATDGDYTLTAQNPDYVTGRQNANVAPDSVTTVDFAMTPRLKLTVSPDHIEADGASQTMVKAHLLDEDGRPQANTTINLITTAGTLLNGSLLTDNNGDGAVDANGSGTVEDNEPRSTLLTSSRQGTNATVTAAADGSKRSKKVLFHKVAVRDSNPHHVVFRRPTEPIGPPTDDPIASEGRGTSNPGTGSDDSPDEEDDNTDDVDPGQTGDSDPGQPPQLLEPQPNDAVEHPSIQFNVGIFGFKQWRAVVFIYTVDDARPLSQRSAIATFATPVYPRDTCQATVKWDDLFTDNKPPSGVYAYDIRVEGMDVDYNDTPSGDSGHCRTRLSPDTFVRNMQVVSQSEDPDTGDLSLKITFEVASADGTVPNVPEASVKCINPQFEESTDSIAATCTVHPESPSDPLSYGASSYQRASTAAAVRERGWIDCEANYTLRVDTPNKLGKWIFVVDAADWAWGFALQVPETAASKTTSIDVTGVALGHNVWSDSSQTVSITGELDLQQPHVGNYATFRAFLRIKRNGGPEEWYSAHDLNATQLRTYIRWIAPFPNGVPAQVKQLGTNDARLLGINVLWLKWHNLTKSSTIPRKTERWYYMEGPFPKGNGLTFDWPVVEGTHWWGAEAQWWRVRNGQNGNAIREQRKYFYPTNRGTSDEFNWHPVHTITVVDPNTEYQGSIRKSGEDRFMSMDIGRPGKTVSRRFLWPNPWAGRISGRPNVAPNNTFVGQGSLDMADDDSFFQATADRYPHEVGGNLADRKTARQRRMQKQAQLNATILEWAYSYLDVPYAWGGTSYGGRQSEGCDELTCSDRNHHQGLGILDGMEFGIDCSGLVSRCAQWAGVDIPILRTGALAVTPRAVDIEWRELRPGDYAVLPGSHVVYARANAVVADGDVVSLDTVEASGSDNRVLRRNRTADRDNLDSYQPRRWIAP